MNSYLTHLRMNMRLVFRNRITIVFAYFFPLFLFFLFGQMGMARNGGGAALVNVSFGLSVIGSGLFGVGIRAVMDREQNILRRFKVAPITPGPIVVSGMLTGIIIQIPMMILVVILAHRLYAMPWPPNPLIFRAAAGASPRAIAPWSVAGVWIEVERKSCLTSIGGSDRAVDTVASSLRSLKTLKGNAGIMFFSIQCTASTGVCFHPVGQVASTSTNENPRPSIWFSMARRTDFRARM